MYKLAKAIDNETYSQNETTIYLSIREVTRTVDNYSDFFHVKNQKIEINLALQNKAKKDEDEKTKLIYKYKRYFENGMPTDIQKTVNDVLTKNLIESMK